MDDDEKDTWSVAEAKAHLSAVIEDARTRGPQTITRHGKKAAVIVAADEWERRTRKPRRKRTLVEVLLGARGLGLEIPPRDKTPLRPPDLG